MIDPAHIDTTSVVTAVRTAFESYEAALLANDVAELDRWFWPDERLVRYGIAEVQHGAAAVAAWRAKSPGVSPLRTHRNVTVTVLGADVAVVALEFTNGEDPPVGRQSQVWAHFPAGWRIVHAHVSML